MNSQHTRAMAAPEGELDRGVRDRADVKATDQLVDALIASVRAEGFVTFDEVARACASAPCVDRAVNMVMKRLPLEGVEIRDHADGPPRRRAERHSFVPDDDDAPLSEAPAPPSAAPPGVDPIQAYLGKMGSLSLLTREGEVEFARRIEAGRRRMLDALARSSIRMPELTDLIERIEESDIR
ncbi:MAG: hypothetical protein KC619_21880, partial [Myxococcales bacterium]|nr:hypothetical protein [Myxococcales bacterium]